MICKPCQEGAALLVRLQKLIPDGVDWEVVVNNIGVIDQHHSLCVPGCCCGHRLDTRIRKDVIAAAREKTAVAA